MHILKIKDLLDQKGITPKYLSEKTGVTTVSIYNILNGNSFPKPELLVKIAETLEVDLKDLFVSTQKNTKEPIYILKDGKYIPIGEIELK